MNGGASAVLLVLAGVVTGCVYYNSLYNAHRLATDAEQAEAEGRSADAGGLWGRVAAKAESVAAKHPASKYRDDAWLLMGRALARLDRCADAAIPLRLAMDSSGHRSMRREARTLLGRCFLALDRLDSATAVWLPLANGPGPAVDRLAGSHDLPARDRAKLLIADGRRLRREGDTAAARTRWEHAQRLAPGTPQAAAAEAELLLARLRRIDDERDLPVLIEALAGAAHRAEPVDGFAGHVGVLRQVAALVVSVSGSHHAVRLFRGAEVVRDSLGAAPLAHRLFLLVAERHPASPIAPKAVLAAAELDSAGRAALHGRLQARYPDSPYARLLRGEDPVGFAELEDSLRALLAELQREARP